MVIRPQILIMLMVGMHRDQYSDPDTVLMYAYSKDSDRNTNTTYSYVFFSHMVNIDSQHSNSNNFRLNRDSLLGENLSGQ